MYKLILSVRRIPWTIAVIFAFSGFPVMAETNTLFTDTEKLNSTKLVALVLERNADIPAMQAAWQAALAHVEQADAFDDPIFSYQIAPQTIGNTSIDFGQKISISQRVPWSGKRGLRADVAQFEADASKQGIVQARLKLIEATQRNYADWYFIHAALRINRINQSLLQEFQNIAEIKYAAGRTSKQDALRAEVEATMLEHRAIILERQRREILSKINTLLQRTPDAFLPEPHGLRKVETFPSVIELRQRAVTHHPDLRTLQAHILASRNRLALADKNFYPDVTLIAGYNSLMNPDEKRLTVGASINIPLRGKRHAASDEIRANTLRLDAEKKAKIAKIQDAVQRAYERVRETENVLILYQNKLLPLATENLAAAQSDYESGRGGFLNLIGAEKNAIQTQLQLEKTQADYHRRLAMLEFSVGGPLNLQNTNNGSNQ